MALLHPLSAESASSELDIFSLPMTQTMIEDGHFVEYFPLATLAPGAPIEFRISGDTGDYLDLTNSFLHVRAKITKADGSPPGVDAVIAPVNNLLHSLFSQCDVTLNDVLISNSENTYAYRAYMETLLSYRKGTKNVQLTSALYYEDTRRQEAKKMLDCLSQLACLLEEDRWT